MESKRGQGKKQKLKLKGKSLSFLFLFILFLLLLLCLASYFSLSYSKALTFSFFPYFIKEEISKISTGENMGSSSENVKISEDVLEALTAGQKVRVAVVLKREKRNLKGINEISNLIESSVGKKIKHKFSNAIITLDVTEPELEALRHLKGIERIEKVGIKQVFLQDSVNIVNASQVWNLQVNGVNITGAGESVCVIDTGINYSHADLGGCFGAGCKVISGYDFCADDSTCSTSDSDPRDVHGHGTHVAGIIAASGSIKGIAPDAKLIALKVCNATGSCWDDDVKAAIDWCIANASIFNISVISISLGGGLYANYCDYIDDPQNITASINSAVANNISVIAASGNQGSTTRIASPACIRNVTAVAATTKSDAIWSSSNRNNITDLVAPGENINSTCIDGSYCLKSGTSMATPHVSGAFALIRQFKRLEKNKILTPQQIQDVLNNSGKLIYDSGSGLNFSRINVYSAILSIDETAPEIQFVAPTEASGALLSRNYIQVNVTASDSISGLKNMTAYLYNATHLINSTSSNGASGTLFINFTNLSDGVYYFNATAYDNAGNLNVTETRNVTIDTTSPAIQFVAPTPSNGSFVNASWIFINISSNEALSMAILEWNGTNESMQGSGSNWYLNKTSLVEESYSFKVYANDSVGNTNVTQEMIVSIDFTPPTIEFNPDSDISGTYERDWIFVNVSCSDLHKSLVLLNWNGTDEGFDSSEGDSYWKNKTGLSDGEHIFYAWCNDAAGNSNFTEARVVIIAAQPPAIALESPPGELATNNVTIQFNCSASDGNGLANITLWHNFGGWHANETHAVSGQSNATVFIKEFADGNYVWSCSACDSFGQCNESGQNRSFVIDTIMPSIDNVNVTGLTSSSATIVWDTSESSNSSINYGKSLALGMLRADANLVLQHSITLNGLSASTLYYYNVTSCDIAGNCNTTGPFNFTTLAGGGGGGGGGAGGGGAGGGAGGRAGGGAAGGAGGGFGGVSEASQTEKGSTFDISQELETNLFSKVEVKAKDKIIFKLKAEQHTVFIESIGSNFIEVAVKSNEIRKKIYLDETVSFDIDADNKADFSLTLERIIDRKAVIKLELLCDCPQCSAWSACVNGTTSRECYRCVLGECQAFNETISCQVPKQIKAAKLLKLFLVLGVIISIILALIVIGIMRLLREEKREGRKEERGEEKKEEKSRQKISEKAQIEGT